MERNHCDEKSHRRNEDRDDARPGYTTQGRVPAGDECAAVGGGAELCSDGLRLGAIEIGAFELVHSGE